VAAAGHVWGHRSALEVFALHLPPNLCNGAAAVSNEGEVWSGAVAAVCSDGRRGGAVGSAAPALARHCAVLVRRGWRTGAGEKHGHKQNVGAGKIKMLIYLSYLGLSSEKFR
jgi:hypothetical protein